MNVELTKQRLDIDEAERHLRSVVQKLESDRKVLQQAIRSIDSDGEDILNGKSLLAIETRKIMRSITATAPNHFYNS